MHCFPPPPPPPLTRKSCMNPCRLPSYETIPPDAPVPGEVAFRICAVREIFEEAGVLLVRDFSQVSGCLELLPGSFKPSVKQLPGEVLKDWMERVHNDAGEFVRMCRLVLPCC